jgi:hypothetical protein
MCTVTHILFSFFHLRCGWHGGNSMEEQKKKEPLSQEELMEVIAEMRMP